MPLTPVAKAFGLAEKVQFLERPASYPEGPAAIETVETHLAWVFLTDRCAYKLKKPARYRFLDFSTLEARHHDGEEEVRLNGRLAPGVYLGVVPLGVDPAGRLVLDGKGEPVDWLVKMQRLPRERMLDVAIVSGHTDLSALEAVARLLADFYRSENVVPMAPAEYRQRLERGIDADARSLAERRYGLPAAVINTTAAALGRFLERHPDLLEARVAAGRIVEGHGDLRPEHICLGPPPVIIDCVEFNRDFRLLDPADELAYLAMECERLGAEAVGTMLLEGCTRRLGDQPPDALLDFYRSVRALLRAKLAAWHLDDETLLYPSQWFNRARAYLALAERYAREP